MNTVPLLLILGLSAITAADEQTLELQVPEYIYPQDNFTIICRARRPLNIMVNHCSIMSRSFQREKDGGFSLTFLVAHAKKECEVKCLTKEQRITKKVLVIDGVITSKYYNVTVSKGIPFALTCSSKCKPGSCQVVWTTNKTSLFVRNDEEHTVWSAPLYKDTQTHYLAVHSASSSTDYHCLLIAITGRIIDSAEQHVYVKVPDNNITRMLIGYLKP